MKTFLLGLFLISPLSHAGFQLGGELVNPGSVPHFLKNSNVKINIPENWTVRSSNSEILASDLVLKGLPEGMSQVQLQSGAEEENLINESCETETHENYQKTFCEINAHQGVVLFADNKGNKATLSFTQGQRAESGSEISHIIQSLEPIEE